MSRFSSALSARRSLDCVASPSHASALRGRGFMSHTLQPASTRLAFSTGPRSSHNASALSGRGFMSHTLQPASTRLPFSTGPRSISPSSSVHTMPSPPTSIASSFSPTLDMGEAVGTGVGYIGDESPSFRSVWSSSSFGSRFASCTSAPLPSCHPPSCPSPSNPLPSWVPGSRPSASRPVGTEDIPSELYHACAKLPEFFWRVLTGTYETSSEEESSVSDKVSPEEQSGVSDEALEVFDPSWVPQVGPVGPDSDSSDSWSGLSESSDDMTLYTASPSPPWTDRSYEGSGSSDLVSMGSPCIQFSFVQACSRASSPAFESPKKTYPPAAWMNPHHKREWAPRLEEVYQRELAALKFESSRYKCEISDVLSVSPAASKPRTYSPVPNVVRPVFPRIPQVRNSRWTSRPFNPYCFLDSVTAPSPVRVPSPVPSPMTPKASVYSPTPVRPILPSIPQVRNSRWTSRPFDPYRFLDSVTAPSPVPCHVPLTAPIPISSPIPMPIPLPIPVVTQPSARTQSASRPAQQDDMSTPPAPILNPHICNDSPEPLILECDEPVLQLESTIIDDANNETPGIPGSWPDDSTDDDSNSEFTNLSNAFKRPAM
ncbi:uncharacterized protein BP5553_00941 [Venustampulla echinocandica]|uniref:Uncharacterized protein n=1 Tax=Venustampulla echinocandica TaxID=2656787 RepID=A0A370TZK3_9HELO|nr:uncharacterized protein BP5553_00941 [Venustampulla echinocandica]RDL40962.1 hypothetical protein BP5553_00941 [Venustampulla echinocandica]